MIHVARGVDSEGVLLLDIVVNGFVPPSLSSSSSSSHVSLQVFVASPVGLSAFAGIVARLSDARSSSSRLPGRLFFVNSRRSSMSHTCRRAKGSCTRGRPRPTGEEGPPWCCAATTPLFMRGRRSARAPCCSCSGCLGSTASTMCLLSPWTFTSLPAFSYQV